MWLLIVACILVYLILSYTVWDLIMVHVYGLPPGPLSLPLIGGLYTLSPRHTHLSVAELGKKYGSLFSIRLGPMGRVVMLQDMKSITQIFEDPDCNDRPTLPIFDMLNRGNDGLGSCSYGPRWKEMTAIFHRGLAKLSIESLEENACHAYIQLFDEIAATKLGEPIDAKEAVYYSCSAVFGSLVYGNQHEDLSSMSLKMRIQDMDKLMTHLNPTHPINVFPILQKLPLPNLKQLDEIVEKRERAMMASYEYHHESFRGQINNLMDIIVSYMIDREEGKVDAHSDVQLKDILMSSWSFYLAGCQTVADVLTWCLLYVAHFPSVQAKIHEDIDQVSVERTNKVLKEKSNLHYTRAAVLEIIRLSSPVAMGLPKCNRKDIKIGKFTIPKGTQMMANQWPMNHDETLWPDPFELKPERFLDDNNRLFSYQKIFHQMPYIPFSFGKRPCPGKLLALDLILIFMVQMLSRFDVRFPKGYTPNLVGVMTLNLQPAKNPVVFTKRQKSSAD